MLIGLQARRRSTDVYVPVPSQKDHKWGSSEDGWLNLVEEEQAN
jgi:hypothetical protein